MTNGNIILTSQFAGINGVEGAINLQDLVCNNANGEVTLSTLDEVGLKVDSFVYISWAGVDGDETKWYCSGGNRPDVGDEVNYPTDVTFVPGQALLLESYSNDDTIQSSGQVLDKDVYVQLQDGNTYAGNSTPVGVNLQDIICSNSNGEITLSTLDDVGLKIDSFVYISWAGVDGDETKWYCSGGSRPDVGDEVNYPTDVIINPGEGLLVEAYSAADGITFPGVELK